MELFNYKTYCYFFPTTLIFLWTIPTRLFLDKLIVSYGSQFYYKYSLVGIGYENLAKTAIFLENVRPGVPISAYGLIFSVNNPEILVPRKFLSILAHGKLPVSVVALCTALSLGKILRSCDVNSERAVPPLQLARELYIIREKCMTIKYLGYV